MLQTTQNFRDKIIDGTSPQDFILKYPPGNEGSTNAFNLNIISARDQDIEADGVSIMAPFNVAEDLKLGECPSASLSMALINKAGKTNTVPWGEWKALIGVKISQTSIGFPPAGAVAYCEKASGDYLYSNGSSLKAVYSGSTHSVQWASGQAQSGEVAGNFTSIIRYGKYYYCYADTFAVIVDTAGTRAAELIDATEFMRKKDTRGMAYVSKDDYGAEVTYWDVKTRTKEVWQYCGVGVFIIKKPKKTLSKTIYITDAYDRMTWFDHDATEYLKGLSFPRSAVDIMTGLITRVYQSYGTDGNRPHYPEYPMEYDHTYQANPFTFNCTYRQALSWIAEQANCSARFNGLGDLVFVRCGTSTVTDIPATRIEHDRTDIAEYLARSPDKLINKNLAGLTYTQGNGDNAYYVLGNPLVQGQDSRIYDTIRGWPEYIPAEVSVLEFDPSIEPGDLITYGYAVQNEQYGLLVDALRNVITGSGGTAIYADDLRIVTAMLPIMQLEISWAGVTRAILTATGSEQREIPDELTATGYNINSTTSPEGILDRIKAVGIDADEIEVRHLNASNIDAGEMSADRVRAGTLSGVRVEADEGDIAGWGLSDKALQKSGTYSFSGWDSTLLAKITAVLIGTQTQAWGIANGCDVDGSGYVDEFDLAIVSAYIFGSGMPALAGSFSEIVSTENPIRVFSVKDGNVIAFEAGIHGVYGRSIFGKALFLLTENGTKQVTLNDTGLQFNNGRKYYSNPQVGDITRLTYTVVS